jgi:cell division protease FtsH
VTRTVNHSEATAVLIDEEMKRFISEAYAECRATLSAHMDGLHRVAAALLEHETLSGEEVRAVLAGQDVKAVRAADKEREERARRGVAPKPAPDTKDPRPAPGAEPQGGYAY